MGETFEDLVLVGTGQEHHILPHMKNQMTAGSFHHKDCLKRHAVAEMMLFPAQREKL